MLRWKAQRAHSISTLQGNLFTKECVVKIGDLKFEFCF